MFELNSKRNSLNQAKKAERTRRRHVHTNGSEHRLYKYIPTAGVQVARTVARAARITFVG